MEPMITEPYASLLNKKIIIPSQKTPYLAVEKVFLLDLMAAFVATIYVDEPWYLGHSPDVGEAIAMGEFTSATDHYIKVGFYEHRMPYEIEVDEPWYLDNYPDIAEAVANGVFSSGTAHFYRNGYREGRFPHPGFTLRVIA
jgi:hypothetical protein